MRPAYIMAMRSHISSIRGRSWVMNSTEKPIFSFSSCILRMMLYCTTTSRAVVGSSKITKSGCNARAMAITTRWRIPPESSWGYALMRAGSIFTSFKSSPARSRAALRGSFSWARMASINWLPMVTTGFRLFMALCSTMEDFSQRKVRSSSLVKASTFLPLNAMVPPDMRAAPFKSCMMEKATVDFPQPDSPARPKNSPLWMSKLTSVTACTSPLSAV